ncbi:hypothetical protein AADG42_01820 [Ammonicoccus fulvus]|uniref:Glycosyltransferase RgtA/B/C/D-like domain-containing protein n=1 Tax=Ammonicoccus fulvus TaxID=3138240 RepID=A0ABZ3FJB1_9ACTN
MATLLVVATYLLQFLLSGAKVFHLMPAFKVYRGWEPIETIPVEFQYDLEAILPNIVGALILGSPIEEPDSIMLRYQAVAFLFVLVVALVGVWLRKITPVGLMLLFVMGQIAKVNLAWIGKPDLFLLGFLLLAVWFSGRPVTFLFGFLAALSHPVIGVLACFVMAAATFAFPGERARRGRREWLSLGWAPAGAIVGLLVGSVFLSLRFPTMAGRTAWAEHAGNALYLNVVPNVLAFAVVALLPLLPFYLLVREGQGPSRGSGLAVRWAVLLVAAAGCFVAAAFFALDHSRVLALLAFPLVALAVVAYGPALNREFRRRPVLATYLLLVVMAVPALVMDGWLGFTHKEFEAWLVTLGRIEF